MLVILLQCVLPLYEVSAVNEPWFADAETLTEEKKPAWGHKGSKSYSWSLNLYLFLDATTFGNLGSLPYWMLYLHAYTVGLGEKHVRLYECCCLYGKTDWFIPQHLLSFHFSWGSIRNYMPKHERYRDGKLWGSSPLLSSWGEWTNEQMTVIQVGTTCAVVTTGGTFKQVWGFRERSSDVPVRLVDGKR